MNKKKLIVLGLALIVAIVGVNYLFFGKFTVDYNNSKLKEALISVKEDQVKINQIIPFEWEFAYSIAPYSSKEDIDQLLGFESSLVEANQYNDALVHLVFVNNDKVVANILKFPDQLGYRLVFDDMIRFDKDHLMKVGMENDIVTLIVE